LRSPLSRKPFGVETGVHAVFHERACELAPRSVYMRAGRAFALCPGCRDGVLYQLPGPSRWTRGLVRARRAHGAAERMEFACFPIESIDFTPSPAGY